MRNSIWRPCAFKIRPDYGRNVAPSMESRRSQRREPKPKKPMTASSLDWFALRYVERFQTTESKLTDYLLRKLKERGWAGEGEPPVDAVVARLAGLGYVNDRLYSESKARGLERRGYGPRRVAQALTAAGVDADLRDEIREDIDAPAAAIAFARRKRYGPFGPADVAPDVREKQLAAFIRAGHGFALARAILAAEREEDLDGLEG